MEKSSPNINVNYKVVILAAGQGRRLGDKTKQTNKALVPLNFKAILSHILEKFPHEVECVVALGFKKRDVRDYLELAHPERKLTFVDVDNFEGPGSGPGYSLLCCQKTLGDDPFIITTVDTLVLETIPPPTEDWLGLAPVSSTRSYNSVMLDRGYVVNMQDKVECDNTHAFIGLCGIRNTKLFWRHLQGDVSLVAGELQLSNGLKALVDHGLKGVEFTWFDTGDPDSFSRTARALDPRGGNDFDFSKRDEFIYFVDGRVIKYFQEEEIAKQRVARARILEGFTPKIERHQNCFYSYSKVNGQVFYAALEGQRVATLLDWLQESFWKRVVLTAAEQCLFQKRCKQFYYEKTLERVALYFDSLKQKDEATLVNDEWIPSWGELFAQIPWAILYEGIPGRFHGDLQFDNILVTSTPSQPFVMIDWRQNFGNSLNYGDIYYDLAKLYGGILLPYDWIKKGLFSCFAEGARVDFKVQTRRSLLEARKIFAEKVEAFGYDFSKVKLLTALIFMNMAPLHTPPFSVLLHQLGKLQLHQIFAKQDRTGWLHLGEEV